MSKAILFYEMMGSLFNASHRYMNWLNENPQVRVISTVYDNDTLLVTFEEINE